MSPVNTQYCIDDSEQGTGDFWAAASGCIAADKRLCSLSEWYYACQNTSGAWNGAQATNDYEWIEFGGANSGTAVGNGGCTVTTTYNFATTLTYRCCYSR